MIHTLSRKIPDVSARSIRHWVNSRLAVLLALLIAGWPVMRWYASRLGDGSDEPWGLIALVAALFFAPWRTMLDPLPRARVIALGIGLALYSAAYAWMPPLIRAGLYVTLIALVVTPARHRVSGGFPSVAWWSLLVLSLPVVATLQFYLGYPLRVVTTQLSVPLIKLGGVTASAAGTTLTWAGERVIVDAPCSGIQMLWTGLFCAAALACWHRLGTRRTFRLAQIAAFTVFVANVLRAALLFFTESGNWPAPAWAHEGIGLALFGCAAIVILFAAERLAQHDRGGGGRGGAQMEEEGRSEPVSLAPAARPELLLFALVLACSAPAWSALILSHARAATAGDIAAQFPGWQAAPVDPLVSSNWTQLPPDAREARFARDFPGKIGVFAGDDGVTYVIRWLSQPTRKLHPAAYCLRALGYDTTHRPIHQKSDGSTWSATDATLGGHSFRVRERIMGAGGHAWTDVSAWYWNAALGRSSGPWWTITELHPSSASGSRF